MAEKVTTMVLKVVDLQCSCCYKKIKKILCKFPQIRDQVYDEKANTVTITVVCCDPEKIRDKLFCKGQCVIKSIEIKVPPKPQEVPKKPKEPVKPEKPEVVVVVKNPTPSEPPRVEKPKEKGRPPLYPVPTCCGQCYGGHDGGPCKRGYGVPRPCFEGYYYGRRCGCRCGRDCHGYYGRPCGCGCGGFSRCEYYLSEENPSSCSVM